MRRRWMFAIVLLSAMVTSTSERGHPPFPRAGRLRLLTRTLDGSGNNASTRRWGRRARTTRGSRRRTTPTGSARWPTGRTRGYVSNRIFNDVGQNLFSENNISQWGWAWGQFLDHDIGLRDETPGEDAPIAFNAADPLESFTNDFGALDFSRTPAAPGTGTHVDPRQQVNTLSSYIDASSVYGVDAAAIEWARVGPVNGNPADNDAALLLPDSYLPTVGARGNAGDRPADGPDGPARWAHPSRPVVAGDVRANENIALTVDPDAVRPRAQPHRRARCPDSLTERAEVPDRPAARRRRGAVHHVQRVPPRARRAASRPYRGYDPRVDAGLSNEFATVGFRAHSMVHGEFEVDFEPGDYSAAQLASFAAQGIEVDQTADEHALAIPLTVAFGNPNLLQQIGLGPVLAASARAPVQERRADRQHDAQRPVPGAEAGHDRPDRVPDARRRPALLLRRRRPRRRRHRARPRPRHAALQRPAPRVRPAAGRRRSRSSPASRPTRSRPGIDDRHARHPRLHRS